MSQKITHTTLRQTVNLIGGSGGMAAGTKFAFGHGFDLPMEMVGQFADRLPIQGRDLSGARKLDGVAPNQRSGKCSLH